MFADLWLPDARSSALLGRWASIIVISEALALDLVRTETMYSTKELDLLTFESLRTLPFGFSNSTNGISCCGTGTCRSGSGVCELLVEVPDAANTSRAVFEISRVLLF